MKLIPYAMVPGIVLATVLVTWGQQHLSEEARKQFPSKLEDTRPTPATREGQLMRLEQYFSQEEIDRSWAAQAVAEIEGVVATIRTGSQVQEIRCATTLCRIVATHDSHMGMRTFTGHLAQRQPFRSQPCTFFYDTQRFRTIAFVGRPEYRWPEADALTSP